MKTLIKYNIKRKWGGKVFLVSLLCVAITGLLPLQAEANDTRNRVFKDTQFFTGVELSEPGGSEITGYKDWSKKVRDEKVFVRHTYHNENVTIESTAEGVKLNGNITFNDYYPSYIPGANFELRVNAFDMPPDGSGWYPSIGSRVVCYPSFELISCRGEQYIKKIIFTNTVLKPSKNYSYIPANSIIEIGPYEVSIWGQKCEGFTVCGFEYYNQSDYRVYSYWELNNKKIGLSTGHTVKEGGKWYYRDDGVFESTNAYYKLVIPADDPSIGVSNVTTDTATISWDTNNTNPEGTSYTLQYQQLKENGNPSNEADWGTQWHTITINGANTTTLKATTQSIFSQNNTYRLRVQVNHVGGSQYNVYSDYVTFSTNTDPAVRAAYEAAIAAQAAKKAAEDGVSYALDAKTAAEAAKTAAVNAEKKSVEIYNLVAKMPPKVNKVYAENSATATTTEMSPPICVDADGATHFELSLDRNNWSSPIPIGSSGALTLNSGVNQIYVRAYNEQIPEESRGYGTGSITIFRLQKSN